MSKIHVNGATRMSLNDRFTIMKTVGGGVSGGNGGLSPPIRARHVSSRPRSLSRPRSRSRSRSRSRVAPVNPYDSIRNRNFLAQLERQHKMRVALQIKRVRFNTTNYHKQKNKANSIRPH